MSAQELIDRVQRMAADDAPLDWKAIRDEIHIELDRAQTVAERTQLLAVFTAVMNMLERSLANDPQTLADLQKVRLSDYRLMIVKESMVGENVFADTLYAITAREIAAGRMAPDDDVRTLAEKRMTEPHPSRDELLAMVQKPTAKGGFFKRLFRQ